MECPRQRDLWHFRRPRERAHNLPRPPQKAENSNLICSKGRPRGPVRDSRPPLPAPGPQPLPHRSGAASAGFSPDSLGLQDEARPLGERAEPHAIDADQALGDRPWGRASCRGQADAVTAPSPPPPLGPDPSPPGGDPPGGFGSGSAAPGPASGVAKITASRGGQALPFSRLLADPPDIVAQRRLSSSRLGFAGDSGSRGRSLLLFSLPLSAKCELGAGCQLGRRGVSGRLERSRTQRARWALSHPLQGTRRPDAHPRRPTQGGPSGFCGDRA